MHYINITTVYHNSVGWFVGVGVYLFTFLAYLAVYVGWNQIGMTGVPEPHNLRSQLPKLSDGVRRIGVGWRRMGTLGISSKRWARSWGIG